MNGEGWLSTVMEVGTLSKRYIDDSELAESHKSFLSNPDPGDPKLLEAIEGLNIRGPDIYKANARLGGKPERPLFWITQSEMLDNDRRRLPTAELADAVRDRLGLIHFEQSTPLAEIRIPRDRLRERRHARPTFADAGDHRRFRTTADGSREKRRSGWGCSVCLRRFKMGETILDGAPERVVEPTDFGAYLGVEFAFVGITRAARDTGKHGDGKFAERICNGTSCSQVITAILDHLQ